MCWPLQLHPHSVVTCLLHSALHSCPVLDTSGACPGLSEHSVKTALRGISESLFPFMAVRYPGLWAYGSACSFHLGRILGCLHLSALQLSLHGFILVPHGRVSEVKLLGSTAVGRCLLGALSWQLSVHVPCAGLIFPSHTHHLHA